MKILQQTRQLALVTALVVAHATNAFVRIPSSRLAAESHATFVLKNTLSESLPSLEQLSTAPFMKQVEYGSEMTSVLRATNQDASDDDKLLKDSLAAQLSHSDGIRGFMVAYLTGMDGDENMTIENEQDPKVLLETLHGLLTSSKNNNDDLISLMCMNVIMPLAMITMHKEPSLSQASRLTAARGSRLLASVMKASPTIRSNLEAILEATKTEGDSEDKLVQYWKDFFGKWGYQEAQTNDIAATMKELLSSSSSE